MGHLLSVPSYPACIVFDLDGTLIDSVPEVCAALNCVLTGQGRRALSVEETFAMVGEGATETLVRAFAATGVAISDDAVPAAMSAYLNAYKDARGNNTVVYDGVRDVLDTFKAADVIMSICTNKPAATTTTTLDGLGLLQYFPTIVCPEDTPHRKPDGRHVLACLGDDSGPAGDAVLVGDSETDMAAARDAGMPFIAVSYGYSHIPVSEMNAAAVIDHFADLPAALERLQT